ncbi:MAG: S41 family peptidase [Rikenellaceae bacterium]
MIKSRFLAAVAVVIVAALSIKGVSNDFGLTQSTELVINLMRELNGNYVDEVEPSKLLESAAGAMARNLDPYTAFLPEEEMSDFEMMTTGKYGGIGSIIRQKGDYVHIAQPYEGSPADQAGLKIGDRIIAIDGVNAKGFKVSDVSSRLKGTPGTKVKVKVAGVQDTTKTRNVTVTRDRIKIPAIPYYGFVGDAKDAIGYVKHTDFTEGSYDEMRTALTSMQKEGLKGLVLDYRDNGGGIMQEAINILSLFVPQGSEVLKTKGRRDSTVYKTMKQPLMLDMPLVVLIDGNSASAAEIVAGALQDLDRAVLIGSKSFGKGLVQSTIPVGYNSYLKLTTARYYIPSGRCIQAIDYSKDGKAGGVRAKVADSVRREFTTKSGRKVFDGGGVTPDIKIETPKFSSFVGALYGVGFIDDFGDEYVRKNGDKNGDIKLDILNFKLSDEEYNTFMEFMKGRDLPYESRTRKSLTDLQKLAKDEQYDDFAERLKSIEADLKDDKATNLKRHKSDIVDLIERDLVMRSGYLRGVIEASLPDDDNVVKAVEVLTKDGEWQRSLVSHKE